MKIDQNMLMYEKNSCNDTDVLRKKIEAGCNLIRGKTFVHTAPHHDDIILSYHAYVMRNLAYNKNHIIYLTSGFNGVDNAYIVRIAKKVDMQLIDRALKYSYLQVIELFATAFHEKNDEQMKLLEICIFIHGVMDIFTCRQREQIIDCINSLIVSCGLRVQIKKDIELVQELKGWIRESESDRKWMISKGNLEGIKHFRSTFYAAHEDVFDEAMKLDLERLVDYFNSVQPDIITVALDPCGIGPKNHFTSLQLIAAALKRLEKKDIKILGYRNVWSNFELQETSIIIPVTQSETDEVKSIFVNCFRTQKNTLFFGDDIDGMFVDQAQQIQKNQWQQVKELCDNDLQIAELQQAVGAIFLKELTLDELVTFIDGCSLIA